MPFGCCGHFGRRAARFRANCESSDARDQIALASVIVLNKAHGATQLIESKLHQLAPFAKILRTTQAKVPALRCFIKRVFTSDHVETLLTQFPHVADHHHTHEIESVSLMVEQAIDPKKFERWLSDLLDAAWFKYS